MAWHTRKARVSSMPVIGYVDLTVGLVTSEHGELEIMPPIIFPHRKHVLRLARTLAKKGFITDDSEVVSLVRNNRVYRDAWVPPQPRSL